MYLNVYKSHNATECDLNKAYIQSMLVIGDNVLNNVNYAMELSVDRFEFTKAKTLSRFDNNLSLKTILFKPKVIQKLISRPTVADQQDIINNITQEINNYFPNDGELIEDQW